MCKSLLQEAFVELWPSPPRNAMECGKSYSEGISLLPVLVSCRVCIGGLHYVIIEIQAFNTLITPGGIHADGVDPARAVSVLERSPVDGRCCASTYAVARGGGRLA